MLLVLDNYDSFTYNLVQFLSVITDDIEVHRNDALSVADIEAKAPEAIVVSPGPCTPAEAGISVDLIATLGPRIPTLGVCLGHQAVGAAFGGRIRAGAGADARQDVTDSPRRGRAVRGPAGSLYRHALSLAHR